MIPLLQVVAVIVGMVLVLTMVAAGITWLDHWAARGCCPESAPCAHCAATRFAHPSTVEALPSSEDLWAELEEHDR